MMRVSFVLVAMMMLGEEAHAQGIGTLPSTAECSMTTLTARVAALNAQCCGGGGNSDCACTIDCSSVLLPLLDECRPLLDVLLDMDDGTRDGVAGQLDTLHVQCLAIPELDVLARLKEMKQAGTCSNEVLNGVAQTEVVAAPCADSGTVQCAALVLAGLDCKDTTMWNNCKATCGLCDGHRRAQLIQQRCSDAQFTAGAQAVDTACCDDSACQGAPTTCDAKCAIAYNDFFDQCNAKLAQSDIVMSEYTDLHNTCATQLPVEPLLRAVIACGVQSRVDLINVHAQGWFVEGPVWSHMQSGGWTWDSPDIDHYVHTHGSQHPERDVLQGTPETCYDEGNNYYNWAGTNQVGTLSLTLPVDGSGTVDFGNCYSDAGTVVLAINGVTIAKADPSTNSVVTAIDFHAGDVLTLQDQGTNSVIRLNSIHISRLLDSSTDKMALLAFMGDSESSHFPGWDPNTNPCGEGWNDWGSGWHSVRCSDQYYGGTNTNRVTWISLHNDDGIRGRLEALAPVTEMRGLYINDTPSFGDVHALSGMHQLGEFHLGHTSVYGDMAQIKSALGLGDTSSYTSCAEFACPRGTSAVGNAADMAGNDACACCSGTAMARDPVTGVCA